MDKYKLSEKYKHRETTNVERGEGKENENRGDDRQCDGTAFGGYSRCCHEHQSAQGGDAQIQQDAVFGVAQLHRTVQAGIMGGFFDFLPVFHR